MRISNEESSIIKSAIHNRDPQAIIYLFGSRAYDNKKGGDIDLLIISDHLTISDKIKIKVAIFEHLEEQKIDIIIAKDDSDPFVKIALAEGIKL